MNPYRKDAAMKSALLILAAGLALVSTSACASRGSGPPTPDEFRVVTKAPLTVPPEYSLRPPAAGTTIPSEAEPTRAGGATAFGTTIGKDASASERALVAAAGANAVNPVIRAQVDYEETRTIRKPASVADRVLFWRNDKPEDVASAAEDNATGGEPVTIQRSGSGPRIKLPGT